MPHSILILQVVVPVCIMTLPWYLSVPAMIDVQIETLPDTVSNAFHGTTLQYALTIEKEGFKHGEGERPFLGYGVYFFRGDQKAAFRWAPILSG